VTLTTPDGQSLSAQVAGRDPGLDIAVLRAEAGAAAVAELAPDADLRVGHLVLALGGRAPRQRGIVSALDTRVGRAAGETLAVDLTLYPGFSGGPLVDVLGRVIGIATSGASRHLQWAIRASAVSRLVDHVTQRGRIPRAYLGIGTQPVALPEALRERLGLEQRTAVIVVNVRPDSPAGTGGLINRRRRPVDRRRRDRGAGGRRGRVAAERVGQTVTVRIVRGGEPRELRVVVGERPPRG
jgi:S1-C subfamily serine protease